MNQALELLHKYWHYPAFRPPQEAVIQSVASKKDAFVLLPTGAGKSLCYQIPALMSEGVCVVVSPLIALMEDQVRSLEEKGIRALMLSSKLNRHETVTAFDNLTYGNYKFLYLSPEKLESPFIQEKIGQLRLNLIAIDEAHCISQWGHDFRPAYLKIPVLSELHPGVPKIALTATATPKVEKDITEHLKLRGPLFKTSYYRENLHIRIKKKENIRGRILRLVRAVDEPVIIYVGSRKNTSLYRQFLSANDIRATHYHGGMTSSEKSVSLQRWKTEEYKVMVATNAFGMGIDKPNVRMIIHAHLPSSIENFIQEIGRAGRDGKTAVSYLLYSDSTIYEADQLMQNSLVSPEFCKQVYTRINEANQIALGEKPGDPFSFDLGEFSARYELNPVKVFHALTHLQNESVLFMDERPGKSSKVMITENSKQLYELRGSKGNVGTILQLLLRTYGGIHDQLTAINESLLASKSGLSKEEVCDVLSSLDQDKVIRYKKSGKGLMLRFLVPREDNFVYRNIKKDIERKNEIKRDKFRDMVSLLGSENCRQIDLLHYFGEELSKPCRNCDRCLDKKRNPAPSDLERRAGRIIEILGLTKELDISEISEALDLEETDVVKTLELLVEKGTIDLNLQNKFYLKP